MPSTRRPRLHVPAAALSGLGLVVSLGCGGGDDAPSASSCVSTRENFTNKVYGKALSACNGCHTPGGTADQRGAKFKIYRETYPDFVTANLDSMRAYAKIEADGSPILLQKPLGKREHGGGPVLREGSEEYKILSDFVAELRSGSERTCAAGDVLGVKLSTNREALRKAAITLAGRFPTDAELGQADSEEGFDKAVLALTNEELFYDRLREIWNDALLTERILDAGVGGVFGNAPEQYDATHPGYTPEGRGWATASVTQEPMRFIEYVVRSNLPFSDVVAGTYVVANPYTAKMYGLPHELPASPENFLAWKRIDFSPVQNLTVAGAPKVVAMPSAGVLSTPSFLTRWETTRTNKGRKRARIVLKNFLATDIFKFAQRPVDSTALTSVQNPTSNSPMCSVCHTVIDPIAGGFRGFDELTMSRFAPDDKWHDDMLPPGVNSVQMPPSSYGAAIMWLGAQIPNDARFGISVAQVMYKGILGDDPLPFPTDRAAPDYDDRIKAFNLQNDWFVQIGKDFREAKYDLRKLVLAIVRSVYFRAVSGDKAKDALHEGLGPGRLLGPEMLGRKYRATTGLYFFAGDQGVKDEQRQRDGYLRSDLIADPSWRLVYGGIDSGDTTKRNDTVSPIMVATSQYTASMVACRSTSYDFTKPPPARRLFPLVEMNTVPFTPRANLDVALTAVPDGERKIRENIKHLFWRLLGQTVAPDSPEVSLAYGLFVDVWKDLEETDLKAGNNRGMTNGRCIADIDYDKPLKFEFTAGRWAPVYERLAARPDPKAPYQPGMRLDRDDNFTIRAWQAVVTFLLMDYRFTHE